MKGKRERTRKQILYMFKKMRIYWKLKGDALDRTAGRVRFARGYELDARESAI